MEKEFLGEKVSSKFCLFSYAPRLKGRIFMDNQTVAKTKRKNTFTTKSIAGMAIFSALSFVTYLLEIPIFASTPATFLELDFSNVKPTLKDAVAGDITAAMPYRSLTNILGFIQAVDQVVPGFAGYETLLYSPELKFYSNRIKMDSSLNTSINGLHCLGDSSGWTRGLMMASIMGVLMARQLEN